MPAKKKNNNGDPVSETEEDKTPQPVLYPPKAEVWKCSRCVRISESSKDFIFIRGDIHCGEPGSAKACELVSGIAAEYNRVLVTTVMCKPCFSDLVPKESIDLPPSVTTRMEN